MKKWIMFCLTLLISITLVACGSDNNKNNEDENNTDNTNANTEEQEDRDSEENVEPDNDLEENEDLDTNSNENADSEDFDIDLNGENIVTLQLEQNGVTMELTYKADGDKVTEQTAHNIMPYESLGVTTQEEAEEILADAVAGYQDAEGITHNMDYQEDHVIETLTINYEEADANEVSELTGSLSDGDLSQGVSLTKSIEMLQEQGFVIVE